MSKKITVAIIGAGQRGKDTYGEIIRNYKDKIEIVAVAEPNNSRRNSLKSIHNIKESKVFKSWYDMLNEEKFCDCIFICTNDFMHYEPAKRALEKGYHIILEKPMSNNKDEIIRLGALSKKYNNQVFMVCHVLRYTPFFSTIKNILNNNEIGELISIQHNENIGYYHMGHSFVRGNWRNSKETSPLMLAKSCHDMDILLYLVNSSCAKISSFGNLRHFKKECAPKDSGERCINCNIEDKCPYSAVKLYVKNIGRWPTTVITEDQSKEGVIAALSVGPYGRCVYRCDNDVVDNQVTILEFNNKVTATFNLCAFTHEVSRTIKLMGTKGEIRGDMGKKIIEIYNFIDDSIKLIDWTEDAISLSGHGGGDEAMILDFINIINKGDFNNIKTSGWLSMESHLMALAAEEARLNNKVINVKEIMENIK